MKYLSARHLSHLSDVVGRAPFSVGDELDELDCWHCACVTALYFRIMFHVIFVTFSMNGILL